jgi:hypothetical protein
VVALELVWPAGALVLEVELLAPGLELPQPASAATAAITISFARTPGKESTPRPQ